RNDLARRRPGGLRRISCRNAGVIGADPGIRSAAVAAAVTFGTNRSSAAIAFALVGCMALAGGSAAAQTSAQSTPPPPPLECPAHDPERAGGSASAPAASGGGAEQPAPVAGGRTPSHMYGVLPNYATVEDPNDATPIPTRLKFKLAALNTFDPYV